MAQARAVTLVGVAGVGKSRLALQVARNRRRAFADGVRFVDVSALRDGKLLPLCVAEALQIVDQSARDQVDVIADFLLDQQLLLVFDNCEHLVDACAALINALLRLNIHLSVLTTSRQPLGVTGERIFLVPPLTMPDQNPGGAALPAAAMESPGLVLFAERAAAVADFTLTEENWSTVAQVCRRLDGLPLAIEMAAVRIRVLSAAQILQRLDDRFHLLAAVDRAAHPRHRTLEAALDWSHDLCSVRERALWARSSVFVGTFSLDAIEQVCTGEDLPRETVMDTVTGLVDKSILTKEEHSGHVRYRLLDTLAHYGRERLQESGEQQSLARRHRDWCLHLCEQVDAESFGPDLLLWAQRVRREDSNLRAALDFSLSTPGEIETGLRMLTALRVYWVMCGHPVEGRHWLEQALALATEPTTARGEILYVLGVLRSSHGKGEAAVRILRELQALAEQLDDDFLKFQSVVYLGANALERGDFASAVALEQRALAIGRNISEAEMAPCWLLLTFAQTANGDLDQAAAYGEQLLQSCVARGDQTQGSWAQVALALVDFGKGERTSATMRTREALQVERKFGDAIGAVLAMMIMSWMAVEEGNHERAAVLVGATQNIARIFGLYGFGAWRPVMDVYEAKAREALGEDAFQAVVARGLAFDFDQAIDYALGTTVAPASAGEHSDQAASPLTRREEQVAELVTQGMSNREIAATLVISQRTAESHVQRMLVKLGFISRAQLAGWFAAQHSRSRPPAG